MGSASPCAGITCADLAQPHSFTSKVRLLTLALNSVYMVDKGFPSLGGHALVSEGPLSHLCVIFARQGASAAKGKCQHSSGSEGCTAGDTSDPLQPAQHGGRRAPVGQVREGC